jgi:hypothetical protein
VSEQASTQDQWTARTGPRTRPGTGDHPAHRLRTLGIVAVCLGVAALAGAAFVLSYSGIRDVARDAGISPQRAGDYPALIDAMLVIALLAVLGLRGAGLPSRIFSWLALLCVLAAAAGADVQHATGHVLRHTVAAATAAALPWALVFIAFVLLLALLRHARLRRQASATRQLPLAADAGPAHADQPIAAPPESSLPVRTPRAWDSASIVPGFSARLVSSAAAGAAAGAAEQPGPLGPRVHDPADADRDQADTGARDETEPAETDQGGAPPAVTDEQPANTDTDPGGGDDAAPSDAEPADTNTTPAETAPEDPPPAGPADAAAAPDDPPAEADADAAPADTNTTPAETAPEDPPPAGPADAAPADAAPADAAPADVGSVGTIPAPEKSDDPTTREPVASDQGADDDVADNMPVFHRMWSTPTPPDS